MHEDNGLSLESLSIHRLFREKKMVFVSVGDGIRKLWKKASLSFSTFYPFPARSIKYIVHKVATEFYALRVNPDR